MSDEPLFLPGSTDHFGRRRFDQRSVVAAKTVAGTLKVRNVSDSLPEIFLHVANNDPLLLGNSPAIRRVNQMRSMVTNKDSEIFDVSLPLVVRNAIETTASNEIFAWKHLSRDPVRYLMAALIEIYG